MQDTTHPVIELILERARSSSKPLDRDDGAVVGLAIEGGGMRGVVSGGMVTALESLGLRDAFDIVYGTSAGALAGAYFLAGQPRLGTSIYYEDLVHGEFVDRRRLLKGKPLISLEFLIDEVMSYRKPLDYDAVLRSPIPLIPVATSTSTFEAVAIRDCGAPDELREALRATARIPLAAGAPVNFRGETYLDGSVVESIPSKAARLGGCTHVLALLTRPRGVLRGEPRWIERALLFRVMNRHAPGLGEAYARRAKLYADEIEELWARTDTGAGDPAMYAIQMPEDGPRVGQLEQDPDVLFAGAAGGAAAVHQAFTGAVPRFYRGLTTYP